MKRGGCAGRGGEKNKIEEEQINKLQKIVESDIKYKAQGQCKRE